MSKRKLKRQLSLLQIVMLGTAGTIGAQIFVLTGHAAGIAGPATVLALALAGILSYSVALNYCEMATAFPVTGGAMTYVREAFGNNILSFLVGSMDCLSSVFYCSLSAMGFAYSLQVFLPSLPVVWVAIGIICLFAVMNIIGVTKVGNIQIVLGGLLLIIFLIYVIAGFINPQGFDWERFMPDGRFFLDAETFSNLAAILQTIALVYVAYIGFEVIADDAEEATDPDRTLPRGILISLTLVLIINVSTVFVSLGTMPYSELAGSNTVITDTVSRFLPGWGVPLMVVGGIIATLTSINTSMLSATREGLTLSRDGVWPSSLSRLGRFRTPYYSIMFVGAAACLIAIIGLVDFLSYISSAGYLFVLFWASLAMIRLRQLYPHLRRPFKAPLFPLTAYLAAVTCFLIVAFSDWKALLFGGGVLLVCATYYYLRTPINRIVVRIASQNHENRRNHILVPVANPQTAESLVRLAAILAQASEDTSICALTVVPVSPRIPPDVATRLGSRLHDHQQILLQRIASYAQGRDVPLYTRLQVAPTIPAGVLQKVKKLRSVSLILMGWPGSLDPAQLAHNVVNEVLIHANTNVAVFRDRGLDKINHILVPVGGGPHSRLCVQVAYEIAELENARITFYHGLLNEGEVEDIQDEMLRLIELIVDELGVIPQRATTRVQRTATVLEGIIQETSRQHYDLIILGSSEEWASYAHLFGVVDDQIVEQAPCSVLMVRRYEPVAISWLRRQVKKMAG